MHKQRLINRGIERNNVNILRYTFVVGVLSRFYKKFLIDIEAEKSRINKL